MITIDFSTAKRLLPVNLLNLVEADSNVGLRKEGSKWKGRCPFHDDPTPSLSLFFSKRSQEYRFHCFGCDQDGDILDYVCLTQGLDDSRKALDWLTGGRAREFVATQRSASHEMGGGIVDHKAIQRIHGREVEAAAKSLRDPARSTFASAREYARRRGWLPTDLVEQPAYPIGVGSVPGFNQVALVFPKFVRTKTAAFLFQLESDFRQFGSVCVGLKYRFTPESRAALVQQATAQGHDQASVESQVPRWVAKTGYTVSIPWEFDAHEHAPALVITEGPGDGARLFHEAWCTEDLASRFARRAHIVSVDSTTAWGEASLPKRGTVGFFDGYRDIILLMDPDPAGSRAAKTIAGLARRQGAQARIRTIQLPCDLSDFFDQGSTMLELIDLINNTRPLESETIPNGAARPH